MMLLVLLSLGALRVGATAELPAWADAPTLPATEATTVIASPPSITAEAAVCSAPTSSGGTSYKAILNPVKDSYVNGFEPDTNYGTSTELRFGFVPPGPSQADNHPYIAFDLSSLPPDAVIFTATLEVFQASGPDFSAFEAQILTSTWTETGVAWNSRPSVTMANAVSQMSFIDGWHRWDLTAMTQQWYAGTLANHGVQLTSVHTNPRVFSSREGASPPRLVVEYQRRVTLEATADTFVSQFTPSTNYGGDSFAWIRREGGQEEHALLRFDTSVIPFGSTVVSATLQVYTLPNLQQANAPQSDFLVAPEAMLGDWDEMVVKWPAPSSESFDDPPTPFHNFGLYTRIDVANIAQAWTSGARLDHGIKLKPTADSTGLFGFQTREWSLPDQRPQLTITFGPPPCYPATGVSIGGATQGITDTAYTFDAALQPPRATPPVLYTWEADEQSPASGEQASITYTWTTPGWKTLTVTVESCETSIVDTHLISITTPPPDCPVPLTGLTLSGPTQGITETLYTFTAQSSPSGATKPVTYTWEADEQSPSSGGQVIRSYTWDTPGTKHVTVTAANCGGVLVQSRTIDIIARDQLPDLQITGMWYNKENSRVDYIIKNSGGTAAPAPFTVKLIQGAVDVAQHTFSQVLEPGWVRNGSIPYHWQCAYDSAHAMVCADAEGVVLESDADNNCYDEWWPCDVYPPEITFGPVVETTERTATIVWRTNKSSRSRVDYWRMMDVTSQSDDAFVTEHEVTLVDLIPNTTYGYQIYVTDETGNLANTIAYYFQTQPPGTDPVEIGDFGMEEYPSDFYEFYTLYADVRNEIAGASFVEFFLEGQLVGQAHTPTGNRFAVHVSPAALGFTRADWFQSNPLVVSAYNLQNDVTSVNKHVTPPGRPMPGAARIINPSAGQTIYVEENPAPAGATLDVLVHGAQHRWQCTDSGWSEGGIVPPGLQPVKCNTVQEKVDTMRIYLDGELAGTYTPAVSVFDHTFVVDLAGQGVGPHTLRLEVQTVAGNSHTTERQIQLVQGIGALDVERTVTRDGNVLRITLTLRNTGTGRVYVHSLEEFVRGLQVIETSGVASSLNAIAANGYQVSQLDFGIQPERTLLIDLFTANTDEITLEAGESFAVNYQLVPILYPQDEAYYIGSEPSDQYRSRVWYRHNTDADYVWAQIPNGNWVAGMPLEARVQQIFAQSDYIIATSPAGLLYSTTPIDWRADQGSLTELTLLLSRMAELAALRNGVLGFVDAGIDPDAFDNLLDRRSGVWGLWSSQMHPNFRINDAGGYVLLVGEAGVIPPKHAAYGVPYSDLRYASTTGGAKPELILGRIVGDDMGTLRRGLENSIDVARTGLGFDRQRALLAAGDCDDWWILNGESTFWEDTKDIRDRLNFPSITRQRWSTYSSENAIRTAFSEEVAKGQSLIVFRGHSDYNHWGGAVFTTLPFPNLDLGGYHPFVYALSCSSGNYRNKYSMAEAWLRQGAGIYIGAVSPTYRDRNSSGGRNFFNRWGDQNERTVGHAFTSMIRARWGDWYVDAYFSSKKWAFQYHMFGDPKFGALPTASVTAIQSAAPDGPIGPVKIAIPDFVVTTDEDGLDYVEIPGGGDWFDLDDYIVPIWTETYTYPPGQRVQAVTLVGQGGFKVTTGLSLPVAIPVSDCDGAAPFAPHHAPLQSTETITGWYPQFEQPYDWSVSRNLDGTSVLELRIYPFTYNPATTDARFYWDWLFDIDVFTTTVDILSLGTSQRVFGLTEPVTATLALHNDDKTPLSVVVYPVITSLEREAVTALPLRTLHNVAGTATLDLVITETLAAGDYYLELTLADMDGYVFDAEVVDFTVGVIAGEVTSLTAAPAPFQPGDNVDIAMTFQNTGDVAVDGVAFIRVQTGDGVLQTAEFTHTLTTLAPGATRTFENVWDSTGAISDTYRVVGFVQYDLRTSTPEVVLLSAHTGHHIYLPLVLREN